MHITSHTTGLKQGIFEFFIFKNVTSCNYVTDGEWGWNVEGELIESLDLLHHQTQNHQTQNQTVYFMLDTFYYHAFAHWIYESAIHLPLYLELVKQFQNVNLKLVVDDNRDYKQLFFDFLE